MKEVKTITWSSKQLASMFVKENIRFDSYVQRTKCWDSRRKSLLIRTVLNGFPRIPEIYATRDGASKTYQCLDGQQRLTTIFDFMNDEFFLVDVDPVVDDDGNVYELAGKKFSDLDDFLKDIILTYSWRVAYYDDLSDEDTAELFYLINNAKPLSQIEHFRCLSPDLKTIQEIGSHELFTTALTQKAFERYTNEDMVIKSYIMLNDDYPSLDNKDVRPTMMQTVFSQNDIELLNKVYDRILTTYKMIVSDENEDTIKANKRIAKRLLTRTHMLSILPIVNRSLNENVSDELFTKWVKEFFSGTKSATKYDEYNSRCSSGSGHAENIKVRLDVIEKDYNEFMKKNRKNDMKNEKEDNVTNEMEDDTDDVKEVVDEEAEGNEMDKIEKRSEEDHDTAFSTVA